LHVPLIPGALGHIECQTSQIFLSGDHTIIVGLIEDAHIYEDEPLLYYNRQFGTFKPPEGSSDARNRDPARATNSAGNTFSTQTDSDVC